MSQSKERESQGKTQRRRRTEKKIEERERMRSKENVSSWLKWKCEYKTYLNLGYTIIYIVTIIAITE